MTFEESVSEILYCYDPAGLAALHVPEDEYHSEARAIIAALRNVDSIMTLKWALYSVFEDFFGEHDILKKGDNSYQWIAEEIWDVWQEKIEVDTDDK